MAARTLSTDDTSVDAFQGVILSRGTPQSAPALLKISGNVKPEEAPRG